MPPRISIGAWRRAIAIAGDSLPVMIHGEQCPSPAPSAPRGRTGSAEISSCRAPARKRSPRRRAPSLPKTSGPLIPPAPPTISIRECQHAIEVTGGISITLRGTPMSITTLATRDISRWVSGEIRFTPKEKELLTQRAPSWWRPGLGARNQRPRRVKQTRGDRRTHRPSARLGETGRPDWTTTSSGGTTPVMPSTAQPQLGYGGTPLIRGSFPPRPAPAPPPGVSLTLYTAGAERRPTTHAGGCEVDCFTRRECRVSRSALVTMVELVSVRDPPALPGRHPEFDSSGIGMRHSPT